MFRKPKTKNIRQRLKEEHDDDEEKGVTGQPPSELSNLKEVITESTVKTKSLLSFDQDEGDDVTEFKLRKNPQKESQKALLKKHKKLVKEYEKRKEDIKQESIEQDEIVVLKNNNFKQERSASPVEEKAKFKVPEKLDESIEEISIQEEVRQKFSGAFDNIPDAKAVYEARKRRERMRKEGFDSGYVPVDDTVRIKNSKGERPRLIREDENDMSDEDQEDGGKFYSSKSLLIVDEERRRAEQEEFLRIEQGDSDVEEIGKSDEDDDELARWEQEQIRKGVSYQKVAQLQNEYNLTSMQNRGYPYAEFPPNNGSTDPQPMDMDVEILEDDPAKHGFPHNLPTSSAAVSMESVLTKLHNRITNRQEFLNSKEDDLRKLTSNLSENHISISGMESSNPNLQVKFRMFQEMRVYTRDLLECLNEKIGSINMIEDDVMKMWKSRSERLIKRRRQDVQDQYEKCAAASSGRAWKVPSDEYSIRESEREARRGRRKRNREKIANTSQHFEGLSSDDEEPISQTVSYKEKIASNMENASNIFNDASDDYVDISNILTRFIDWITVDNSSFEDAHIPICIPKLLSPFIRLQLLDWDPLKKSLEESDITKMIWYRQILRTSSHLKSNHPAIINLVPIIVEKILTPLLTKMVSEQWDPLSLSQSTNLSRLLQIWKEEYPTITGSSRTFLALLEAIRKKAKSSIDDDTFVPLYSKEAIENSSTGCGPFVDRQFWTAIKLMRSLSRFRKILSNPCLEELIMEGIVNRSVVLSLQFSILSDSSTVSKCRAVIEAIDSEWLPPTNAASYRSIAAILGQICNEHKSNREFSKELRKFIDLVRIEKDGD